MDDQPESNATVLHVIPADEVQSIHYNAAVTARNAAYRGAIMGSLTAAIFIAGAELVGALIRILVARRAGGKEQTP